MPRKSYKPEEIVAKLRQVDVLTSQGQGVAEAIRSIGVSEVTYYRWRQEFGGLKSDQVKRLKDLKTENTRLSSCGVGPDAGQADPAGGCSGKLLSPARRRASSMFEACCRFPSAVPVRRSGSTARRSARSRGAVTMKNG